MPGLSKAPGWSPGGKDGTEDNSPGQQSQWTESLPAMTSHRTWTGPFLLVLFAYLQEKEAGVCVCAHGTWNVGQSLINHYEKGSVNIPTLWVGKPSLKRRQPPPSLVSGT